MQLIVYFVGWQWSASDRPTFHTIKVKLENMFQNSSIVDGE